MTTDEAIQWLQQRSVLAIFHQDRIVLVAPRDKFHIDVRNKNFTVSVRRGMTFALGDPGDSLADVVQAALVSWREKASPVDAINDSLGSKAPPVQLDFVGDLTFESLFSEMSDG